MSGSPNGPEGRLPGPDRFPETHWSVLIEVKEGDQEGRRRALETVFRQYYRAVYQYIRAMRQVSDEHARDLAQGFFVTLLSRGVLGRASPDRGSFRAFLKTCLRNFVIDTERQDRVRSDREREGQESERAAPAPAKTPDEIFDREWALRVLADAVGRLREEAQAAGKSRTFDIFSSYCLGSERPTYRDLAQRYGIGEDQVTDRLREARQRIRDILAEMLRGQLGPGESVQDEIKLILSR